MLVDVHIEGFRSCRDCHVDLSESLIALVGRNGVGKTTILQAIAATAGFASGTQGDQSRPFGVPSSAASVAIRFRVDSHSYTYKVSTIGTRDSSKQRPFVLKYMEELRVEENESIIVMMREGPTIITFGKHEQISINESASAISAIASLFTASDPAASHVIRVKNYLQDISYYSLDDRSDLKDIVLESEYRAWLQQYESSGVPAGSIAYRLLYLWEYEKAKFEEFKTLIGDDGIELIDDIDVAVFPSPGGIEKRYYISYTPASKLGGAGLKVAYSSLSAGTRRVLRLLSILLVDRRSVALLEQPEDSIHHGLLQKVIGVFREYADGSQMVFSTHSSDILDLMHPEEVRLVDAAGGSTSARHFTSSELEAARDYLRDRGNLGDFLDSIT
jgi:predicted ATPase